MARKKRSRGFGGSPEEHRRQAGTTFDRAISRYSRAQDLASGGKCSKALVDLIAGAGYEASARTHMMESVGDDEPGNKGFEVKSKQAYSAFRNANGAFSSECMMWGGGMSGLGARRRRSRR